MAWRHYADPCGTGRRCPVFDLTFAGSPGVELSGIGVDQCRAEFGHRVGEFVFGAMRDAVRLRQIQGRVDVKLGVGVQAVPDPAHPHTAHRLHPRLGCQGLFGGVDHSRVHSVEQSAEHIAHRGT
jgi:hypothetical protein